MLLKIWWLRVIIIKNILANVCSSDFSKYNEKNSIENHISIQIHAVNPLDVQIDSNESNI